MSILVAHHDDPGVVLAQAGHFLEAEPVLHNLVLTLLHDRCVSGEAGRYWIARENGAVRGVVLQSPPTRMANVVPMPLDVCSAVADEIAASGVRLPGVSGEAGTAARFAGRWTERSGCGATPGGGLRIYEMVGAVSGSPAQGALRCAGAQDRRGLLAWMRAFQAEVGGHGSAESIVDTRLANGQFWLWDVAGSSVCVAGGYGPTAGVTRIQYVYTPPDLRRRGYAEQCVSALTRQAQEQGLRCMLFTDLANPVSNSIYRRIGYRAVAEALTYTFQ